jgi:xanthine dehydrogenase accessory factor
MLDVKPQVDQWRARGVVRVAAAVLVSLEGSGVRLPGALFAVADDGSIAGSVSGGCIEPQLIDEAERVLSGKAGADGALPAVTLVRYDQSGGRPFSPLQPCSDAVELAVFSLDLEVYDRLYAIAESSREALFTLFLDGPRSGSQSATAVEVPAASATTGDGSPIIRPRCESARSRVEEKDGSRVFHYHVWPPPHLVIVGASHIGQELAVAAGQIGFRVSIVDTRERFVTPERFPSAANRLVTTPQRAFDALGVNSQTAICAISHDDKLDDSAIMLALERDCYYIGALGSPLTHSERCRRLFDLGVKAERLEEIRAPIGISIGAVTPAEIAISIAAEVSGVYRTQVPKRG